MPWGALPDIHCPVASDLSVVLPPLRCRPEDALRWKADAARAGFRFSDYVRAALDSAGGRVPSVSPRAKDPALAAVKEAVPQRVATPRRAGDRPDRPVSSSACPGDVSRGVRCRLCQKVHQS